MSDVKRSILLKGVSNINDSDFLHALSDHPDHDVRLALVKNPNTSPETLHKLLYSHGIRSDENLARRILSPNIISSGKERQADLISWGIMQHPKVSKDTLYDLIDYFPYDVTPKLVNKIMSTATGDMWSRLLRKGPSQEDRKLYPEIERAVLRGIEVCKLKNPEDHPDDNNVTHKCTKWPCTAGRGVLKFFTHPRSSRDW